MITLPWRDAVLSEREAPEDVLYRVLVTKRHVVVAVVAEEIGEWRYAVVEPEPVEEDWLTSLYEPNRR
jgi:hypothetical protein